MSHRPVPSSERGQVLPLVIVLLPLLLLVAGAVVDIGSAYLVKGRLQAATDAAALAGAQRLPDATAAAADAQAYGAAPGARNAEGALSGVSTRVELGCVQPSRFCSPGDPSTSNAVTVEQSGSFQTAFLRLFGFSTISVDTKATACSPCGAKPLDVMIVLDRTGSMCTTAGKPDPPDACIDLGNAREGIKTFLTLMDPASDRVGLTVLPPGLENDSCTSDQSYASQNYVVVPLSSDYLSAAGALNYNSSLLTTLDCLKAGGNTAYATAIDRAQAALEAQRRPNAEPVIVFLSDGAANIGPASEPQPYRDQPCHQGVRSAQAAVAKGTVVYSIGYDLDAGGTIEKCRTGGGGGPLEQPEMTALEALEQIGTDAAGESNFYNKPDPGQLNTIFRRIAADIGQGTSRLIG
jgi:Putative Flp pilus-assembly TadE/G-like/von Willebrand factor type A domain